VKLTPRERTVYIAEEFGQKSKMSCDKKVFGTGLKKKNIYFLPNT
jgi:hypothetical protein